MGWVGGCVWRRTLKPWRCFERFDESRNKFLKIINYKVIIIYSCYIKKQAREFRPVKSCIAQA